jgi:hypothetical protein
MGMFRSARATTQTRWLIGVGLPAVRFASITAIAIAAVSPTQAQRARVSINDGWKFHRGDPASASEDLRYEVLPELKLRPDGADFDAGVMDDSDTAVRKGILRSLHPAERQRLRSGSRTASRAPGGQSRGDR